MRNILTDDRTVLEIFIDNCSIFTNREKETLKYRFRGHSNEHIAILMNITVSTVRRHMTNVYEKLNIGGSNRTKVFSLINYIVREGSKNAK